MRCQNCGFESADNICSVCGLEIVEALDETAKISANSATEQQTADTKKQKPKKRVKKILLFVLIIILSAVVVSASSIAVFYYSTNDSRTKFSKINQAANCGDFSIKLKEVKTPEFQFEYYPQIVYDIVFEFHNNTSRTLILDRPKITGLFADDSVDRGYMNWDLYTYYDVNGKKTSSVSFEIPAWSSVEIIERFFYEDYSDDYLLLTSGSMQDSVEDDENGGDDSGEGDSEEDIGEDDSGEYEVIIDESKIKYKKEGLQKYKDNSPENFYLIVSDREFLSDEEEQYARFFVEPDKEAIVIPEEDNIE